MSPSPRPRHLIATYHYVRPENSDGVTGLTPEAFETQIRALDRRYTIVPVDAFVARAEHESGLALITFDDAVRDQYEFAAPILESLGLPAVFFAPMRPFDPDLAGRPAERWITQHLVHALAEHLGWTALEAAFDIALAARGETVQIDADHMNRLYHYEVPAKRRLKYIAGFVLDPVTTGEILTRINTDVGLAADRWFMTAQELADLARRGFDIGGHGYDHRPYSTMSPAEQEADLRRARDVLDRLVGPAPRALAYPFGRSTSETPAIAAQLGYTHCFGVDERVDARDVPETLASGSDMTGMPPASPPSPPAITSSPSESAA